jgi:hypothetical protein
MTFKLHQALFDSLALRQFLRSLISPAGNKILMDIFAFEDFRLPVSTAGCSLKEPSLNYPGISISANSGAESASKYPVCHCPPQLNKPKHRPVPL